MPPEWLEWVGRIALIVVMVAVLVAIIVGTVFLCIYTAGCAAPAGAAAATGIVGVICTIVGCATTGAVTVWIAVGLCIAFSALALFVVSIGALYIHSMAVSMVDGLSKDFMTLPGGGKRDDDNHRYYYISKEYQIANSGRWWR
jgi:hypothetical protein